MSEYIIELESKCSIALILALAEETRGGDALRGEIVRCRDCAYINHREYSDGLEYQTCSYFDSEYAEVEPYGFCAWGERRGDAR